MKDGDFSHSSMEPTNHKFEQPINQYSWNHYSWYWPNSWLVIPFSKLSVLVAVENGPNIIPYIYLISRNGGFPK